MRTLNRVCELELLRMLGSTVSVGWRASSLAGSKTIETSTGKTILMFTKSSGFEHSVVKRRAGIEADISS